MTPTDLNFGKIILASEVKRDWREPPGGVGGPIVGGVLQKSRTG